MVTVNDFNFENNMVEADNSVEEVPTVEVLIDNVNSPNKNDVDDVKKKHTKKRRVNAVRFDQETGHVLLRVSNSTEPKKLGGAIFKNFKDGCKALVVSFIGKDATVQALKGISVANVYLETSKDEDKGALVGKAFCILPRFHTFSTELGDATTTKIIVYTVDADLVSF